jgi:hypothetical protein
VAEEGDEGSAEGGGGAEADEELEAEDGGGEDERARVEGLEDAAGEGVGAGDVGGERGGDDKEAEGGEGRESKGEAECGEVHGQVRIACRVSWRDRGRRRGGGIGFRGW